MPPLFRPIRAGLAALPLALLAACGGEPVLDRQAVLDEVLANYRANLAGMQPLDAPPVAEAAAGTAAMPALAGAPTQAQQLLGQPPAVLRRLLGEPRLRRREGEAEIWLYQSPFCHLDVMLYGDAGGADLRVTYATARAAGAERRTEAACLRELAAQHGA
ncbi:hypothetical protein [Roseomonas haemaphysalidis]|uniref:Outer membrane protein assembly factor BamE n=1 Tax=Roseomonas haemaphysalidis TaxID=2768162 RepID=A0ABS3KR18_9PROT|nr:hypothetical protein [Roseomonas haemaphysalidis]MBO1079914.1 hypothetical protein [Roseomonas haemaphysalidis]